MTFTHFDYFDYFSQIFWHNFIAQSFTMNVFKKLKNQRNIFEPDVFTSNINNLNDLADDKSFYPETLRKEKSSKVPPDSAKLIKF
jgi:hypothetical protein